VIYERATMLIGDESEIRLGFILRAMLETIENDE
jgi:hypothetical protein